MGVISYIGDGLKNLVANLGTGRDKASHSYYGIPTFTELEAVNAYRGSWLPRKIVDIPALDACRNWRNWNATADEISKLEAEETRLGLQQKVLEAMTLARLRGGAAIYIGTGDNNPMEPLNPERIGLGGIKHLNVLSKRVVTATELDTDPGSPHYNRPKAYRLTSPNRQVEVHPSRLVIFIGNQHPEPELAAGESFGWGDSVLTSIVDALKNADSAAANVASLVFEAKVDVIKIPGFMQGLAQGAEYENQVLARLRLAAIAKGTNGQYVMDAEEDYSQKQVNFSNLPEVIQSFLQMVSGAADIPLTRLLGQSPAGMNSTGESDVRNYYDRIQAMQNLTVRPALTILDECLIRSALGSRPPELFYDWRSLWQSTAKERADIGKTTAETIKIIDETGLVPEEVMAKVAQNMLVEAGVAPGMETAMDDFLKENPEWTPEGTGAPTEEDLAAATPPVVPAPLDAEGNPITDAAPRTLYVQRKVTNAAEIVAWAKAQGFEATLPAEDMHVTIAFSRQPVDWMKVGTDYWSSNENGKMNIAPGGARLIEQFDGGAVVLLFNSSQLAWRHEGIKEAGATWDWPEYQPHITITYDAGDVDLSRVEPYRGAIELGPEIFEELDEDWKSKVQEE